MNINYLRTLFTHPNKKRLKTKKKKKDENLKFDPDIKIVIAFSFSCFKNVLKNKIEPFLNISLAEHKILISTIPLRLKF